MSTPEKTHLLQAMELADDYASVKMVEGVDGNEDRVDSYRAALESFLKLHLCEPGSSLPATAAPL